ncbi:MAG: hypothetical protein KDD44_06940 [Bdellovibrionales bacterium]|nr:hypothetical protein [Bdellovibrionales bacterium]
MKRNFRTMTAMLLLGLAAIQIGCRDEPVGPTPTSIVIQFQQGNEYLLTLTTEHIYRRVDEGQANVTRSLLALGIELVFRPLTRGDVSQPGIEVQEKVADATIRWVALEQERDGSPPVAYDSREIVGNPPVGGEWAAAMLGITFTIRFTPSGLPKATAGVSDSVERALNRIDGSLRTNSRLLIMQRIGPGALVPILQYALRFNPDTPVVPGDSWVRSVDLASPFAYIANQTWTLNQLDPNELVIGLKEQIVPGTPPLDRSRDQTFRLVETLGGSGSGEIRVPLQSDRLFTGTIHRSLRGTQQFEGPAGSELDGKKWPVEIEIDQQFAVDLRKNVNASETPK